jgi:predicted amidophosphoribosyltransferase
MTLQSIFVASLSDINFIRLGCATCGAHISYDPEKEIHVPDRCPQCMKQFAVSEKAMMDELMQAIISVRRNISQGSPLAISMEFHGIDQAKTS